MGKTQFCRICRTQENLKYTTKELRQLNKEQLLLAQANNRASKKLLLATPTLGNICQICDKRIQIFHRLDDADHENDSDIEVDVVSNESRRSTKFVDDLPNSDVAQSTQRPDTPVIVDDDDMLFNIFMQKFDQKSQFPQHQISSPFCQPLQNTQMTNFHSTYTPPQSTGGSEGDDTKIIEVLTSRESTPAPILPKPAFTTSTKQVNTQSHRIVAIIDLDEDDDDGNNVVENQKDLINPYFQFPQKDISAEKSDIVSSISISSHKCVTVSTIQTDNVDDDDDDEEIVFKKIEDQEEKSSILKKRRRKAYDEKKLRLVACLNLVSSDSEPEDTSSADQVRKLPNDKLTVPLTSMIKKNVNCKVCKIKFPDAESLSAHDRIHQGVLCTLCKFGFPQVKRLVHHMRRKHREYNGDALSEKPRSGQDSCMTIRLRYMQQTTFYECQLCGRIDDVFREHKEHILETHPNESKSLKDPIMKQLKCPICKVKCGAQYLSLCRHLISSHEYPEYKSHLRELVHVSAFGWNASRQQEVAKSAKIFQFIKRKTFFFECKICCKVVAGYLHHLRHVNEHQKNGKDPISKEILKSSTLEFYKDSNSDKLCKTVNNNRVCISKNLRNRESLTKKASSSNLKTKNNQIEKVKKVSKKLLKPEKSCIKVSKFKTKYVQKVKTNLRKEAVKKPLAKPKDAAVKKINLKNKCKPKEKDLGKLGIYEKITQEKKKKEPGKKDKQCKKQSAKEKDFDIKLQVKKVKVKTPIKQIDLQKYKCTYCLKKFKGFRCYNLHVMRQHKENEFSKCKKCNKIFGNAANLKEHVKKCSQFTNGNENEKRKRKMFEVGSSSEKVSANSQPFAKKVPDTSDISSVDSAQNYLWLKDLLIMKNPLKISDSNIVLKTSPNTALLKFQCCYCLHIWDTEKDLKEHKEVNHLQDTNILFKFKPLRPF